MKHRIILLVCASIILNFQLSTFDLVAQPLPQGYFRNPMDHDIGLSATFAEFRANHFHGGLDMRTGGAIGKHVYAAADGYVAKVSISPWGGGKILYIKHPNGYTTVYMHLDGYAGAIGKAVLKEQYDKQSYSINKLFAPDEFPVKKGQLVAYSGNTGGSGGPHLHFEVRSGGTEDLHTHSTLHNPLLFGLPYTDNIKPVIRGIHVYTVDGKAVSVDKENSITVNGPFYLGIYATDAAEGSTAKNGVERVEVYLDGTLFFMYTTESVPTDSSRMDNALIDYRHYADTRQAYLLTRALPGAEGPWIPIRTGDGIFRLQAGSSHRISIKVFDIKENCAERTVTVRMGNEQKTVDNGHAALNTIKYDQPFNHQTGSFRIDMNALTLYADDAMVLTSTDAAPFTAPVVVVRPTVNDIPPHQAYSLSIKPQTPFYVPPSKVAVVRLDGKRMVAYATSGSAGWYTAQVRDFGRFTLAIDTVAPTVKPLNFAQGKPLKGNNIRLKIGDDLSGVDTYNCYLNGSWILAEYDGKSATLSINAAGKLKAGSNELTVEVTDGCGNLCRRSYSLTH